MKQDLKQRQIRAFFQIFGRKIKIFEQVKKPKCLSWDVEFEPFDSFQKFSIFNLLISN